MTMADTDIYNTAIVNKKYNGWRIDKFLTASFPDISRSQIQRLLNEGNVSCNGAVIEDNSCKVRENETYQLIIPEPEDAVPEPEDIPLEIVYEDDDLVVVNKPAGMTVHPAPGSPRERWLTLCCTIVKAGCRVSAVSNARESSIELIRIHQGFWLWPKMIRHIKTCANSLPDILLKGLIMLWFSGCRIRQTAELKRLSAAVRMIVKKWRL